MQRNLADLANPLQITISGEKVSTAQAAYIILRTDEGLHAPPPDDASPLLLNYAALSHLNTLATEYPSEWQTICRSAGVLPPLRALNQTWSYTPHIEGNYGWMHPDGVIWMDRDLCIFDPIDTLFQELKWIAKSFPFLTMNISLMDNSCKQDEAKIFIAWKLQDGIVKVTTSSYKCLHGRSRQRQELHIHTVIDQLKQLTMPCVLDEEWLFDCAMHVRTWWNELSDEKHLE